MFGSVGIACAGRSGTTRHFYFICGVANCCHSTHTHSAQQKVWQEKGWEQKEVGANRTLLLMGNAAGEVGTN